MNWPAICRPLAIAGLLTTPVLAEEADAARGAELFVTRCGDCHVIGESADSKIGPNLRGLIGRRSGTLAGYDYSDAMKGAGIDWSADTLKGYLVAPRKVVPGTRMNFNGLKGPGDVEDIVAYLLEAAR